MITLGKPLFATLFTILCASAYGYGSGCATGANACTDNGACINSQAAVNAGRCYPKEVFCDNGACRAQCAELCQTVQPDFNACSGRLICNDSRSHKAEVPYCTGLPIACSSVDDCPLFLPSTSDAGPDAGRWEWECRNGACRYPGFQYAYELLP